MNRDEFIKKVAENVVAKSEGRKSVLLTIILTLVLNVAVKFLTTWCINNVFAQRIFLRRAIRKACLTKEVGELAAKESLTGSNIFDQYGVALVEEILEQRKYLSDEEIREMTSDLPID